MNMLDGMQIDSKDRHGAGIKRAITTGRKAKGHHWYWADEISEDSQR